VYALEANPNPDLREHEDLALSAQAEGVSYPELLQRIVNLGINYRAAWDTASE
jgi:D-alanine-D-alanine ligase